MFLPCFRRISCGPAAGLRAGLRAGLLAGLRAGLRAGLLAGLRRRCSGIFFDCFGALHNKRSCRPMPAKRDCAAPVCGRRNGPCLCLHRFSGARAYAAGVRAAFRLCIPSGGQLLARAPISGGQHSCRSAPLFCPSLRSISRSSLQSFGPLFSIRDGGAAIPLCRRDR